MLIIQCGTQVYGYDEAQGEFVQLPLTYNDYPTSPTPDALNTSIEWLINFLQANYRGYTIRINEEASKGPTPSTIIVYADIVSSDVMKKENLALYTIANAITTGTEKSLETTLKTELK